MNVVRDVAPFVLEISDPKGGSGNPSPVSVYGVYLGTKAAAKQQFDSDILTGKKGLVQGIGHFG